MRNLLGTRFLPTKRAGSLHSYPCRIRRTADCPLLCVQVTLMLLSRLVWGLRATATRRCLACCSSIAIADDRFVVCGSFHLWFQWLFSSGLHPGRAHSSALLGYFLPSVRAALIVRGKSPEAFDPVANKKQTRRKHAPEVGGPSFRRPAAGSSRRVQRAPQSVRIVPRGRRGSLFATTPVPECTYV